MANISIDKKADYTVVALNAEKLDGQTTPKLRSELVLLAGDSVKNMILDLSNCTYCDTTGLSAILIAHRLCKDGCLILCGLSSSVENMLSIQRFNPPLQITLNLEEAEKLMQRHIHAIQVA